MKKVYSIVDIGLLRTSHDHYTLSYSHWWPNALEAINDWCHGHIWTSSVFAAWSNERSYSTVLQCVSCNRSWRLSHVHVSLHFCVSKERCEYRGVNSSFWHDMVTNILSWINSHDVRTICLTTVIAHVGKLSKLSCCVLRAVFLNFGYGIMLLGIINWTLKRIEEDFEEDVR